MLKTHAIGAVNFTLTASGSMRRTRSRTLRRKHVLAEIAEAVHSLGGFVTAEDERNEPQLLLPPERGGMGLDAMWADDFHHVVRVMLTGTREGYYKSYEGTAEELAATLEHGWLFEGGSGSIAVVANQQQRRACFRSNSFSALRITIKSAITLSVRDSIISFHRRHFAQPRRCFVSCLSRRLFSWVRSGRPRAHFSILPIMNPALATS